MGHSYIDYRGNSVHVHDAEIALVVYATLAYVNELPHESISDRFKSLMKHWSSVIDVSGPGCIDLELDAHLVTETDRLQFIELLSIAERRMLKQSNEKGEVDFEHAIHPIQQQSIFFDVKLPVEQIKSSFCRHIVALNGDSLT